MSSATTKPAENKLDFKQLQTLYLPTAADIAQSNSLQK